MELNVIGQKMSVRRSTLTLCDDSVLARKFDVAWASGESAADKGCAAASGDSAARWSVEEVAAWVGKLKGITPTVVAAFRENEID